MRLTSTFGEIAILSGKINSRIRRVGLAIKEIFTRKIPPDDNSSPDLPASLLASGHPGKMIELTFAIILCGHAE